ncbi:hypothetical protein BDZ89DRAFT_1156862 [Hymenopellis radicata]|nr:hypothetical protein BDZ89DRAFT_1156862 [Hymenopellis radicata]
MELPTRLDLRWQVAPPEWQEFYRHWNFVDKNVVLEKATLTLHPLDIELLVRESYPPLFDRVYNVAEDPSGGVVIIGQPGIGKTVFLWYSLIRLITLHQVILFAQDNRLYLFYEGTVHSAAIKDNPTLPVFPGDPQSRASFIWTLIDVDLRDKPPATFLIQAPCFPIQAASPNPLCYKLWSKYRLAARMSLPLWSKKELRKGLQPLYNKFRTVMAGYLPPSPDRLPPSTPAHLDAHRVLCELWKDKNKNKDTESRNGEDDDMDVSTDEGGEAKDREDDEDAESSEDDETAKSSEDDETAESSEDRTKSAPKTSTTPFDCCSVLQFAIFRTHNNAIASATYTSLSAMVRQFSEGEYLPDQVSHCIIAISPVYPPPYGIIAFSLDFKSPCIAEKVIRRIAETQNDRLVDLYQLFRSIPQSSALAGWCLEPIAFRILTSGDCRDCFLVEMAGNPTQDAPIFKATLNLSSTTALPFPIHPGDSIYYDNDILDSLKPGPLYIPNNDKNPLFDALWINSCETDTSIDYSLWVFQVSKSIVHKGSARGYVLVRKVIKGLKKSATPGKSVRVKVSYLYACPRENQAAEWKMPKGWTKSIVKVNHQGEVFCWPIPIPASLPPPS